MQLSKDFQDLLELFNQHGVQYLVAGGYATSIYAEPRYTKDLDLWVEAEPGNAKRILSALREFGFGSVGLELSDFTRDHHVVQLGREPNRIDILTQLKGLDFLDCYPRRRLLPLAGLEVPFLSKSDLITNKKAVGRLRDLADVEELERSNP